MITIKPEMSLFDHDAQCLVNTVNCVGVMGKGVALEFKKRFPKYFAHYKKQCQSGREILPGRITDTNFYEYTKEKYIVSFPTKAHWKNDSQLYWIESGLEMLKYQLELKNITSVSMPFPGCGNGNLPKREVFDFIYKTLGSYRWEHYKNCQINLCGSLDF